MLKIGIQGIKGSFHHIAISNIYNKLQEKKDYYIYEYDSFQKLVNNIINYNINIGIMAIENSIVGDILSNYILIDKYNLKIIYEIYIPISHQLMVIPGQGIKDIKEILSHQMAILQCNNFFQKYPNIKPIEYYDTAGAAKFISNNNGLYQAAIAPKLAADIYKLEIIMHNIQDINNNYTRFFVIQHPDNKNQSNKLFNKASISFIYYDNYTFYKVIQLISYLNIKILKIQSIPQIKKLWKYIIFFDLSFNDLNSYLKMKKEIIKIVNKFCIIGEYKNGKM